ncbi:MAG: C4-dicarboxylate ABC transporter substrate-binding protein [Minwuia thermotolerans]|nr:MAG: C4-dicarboxylate ABC transporter substrate-binding protein [Minwuia thermotolerans]
MKPIRLALTLALTAFLVHVPGARADDGSFRVRIATGSLTGVYYSAGNAVCRVLERRFGGRVDCKVVETGGTGTNIPMLSEGRVEFAIAQADILLASTSSGRTETIAEANGIRAIAALYPEVFQVVARRELGLERAGKLVDYRTNLGMPDSGTRKTIDGLLRALDMSLDEFRYPMEIPGSRDLDAFCNREIDAFAFVSGVPNGKVALALQQCGGAIVGFVRQVNAGYVRTTPGVEFYRFRKSSYPGMVRTVDTFAVPALLVTRQDMEGSDVRRILGALLDDIAYLSKLHPAWSEISTVSMARDIEPALMHDGAKAEYLARRILPFR